MNVPPRHSALLLALILTACASNQQDTTPATVSTPGATTPAKPAEQITAQTAPTAPKPVAPAALRSEPERRPQVSAPAAPAPANGLSKSVQDRLHREARDNSHIAEAKRAAPAGAIAGMPHFGTMPMPAPSVAPMPEQNNERYGQISDNPVKLVAEAPVSTFSIDVDTGSYSNVRRMLNAGTLPPADAVRVEELVNYFPYDYGLPKDGRPFAVHTALSPAPWKAGNVLLRIAIKGQDVAKESLPPANLVFLVDVSGSMHSADKLPLLKSSLKLLVQQMRAQDRIALVTYASGTSVVLPSTSGNDKASIVAAIDALRAGGSTAGASGIQLAYQAAQQGFVKGGINRILLATDGDFNVGISDTKTLTNMIEERRKSGISLSTLGFGTGNYNEDMMEKIADVGDGAYSYIDNLMEGHKVLVNEMSSTLATIARDVKVQVEFNPAAVKEYRLIGYENRMLKREDFNNDQVDAGDIGAGHTVTALYELTLADGQGMIDALRYGNTGNIAKPVGNVNELAHLKLRYKQADANTSQLMDTVITRDAIRPLAQADAEFRFATAVAGFGQHLRGARNTGNWSLADARTLAAGAIGNDRYGYRGEFLRLMDLAQALGTRPNVAGNSLR